MSLSVYSKYSNNGEAWLESLPAHWKIAKLRHLASIGMGQTILRDMLEDGPGEGTLPVYSASESDEPFGYFKNPNIRLKKGDLIVGARGSIGMTRIVKSDSTCTQTTIWLKLDRGPVNSDFVYWTFVGGREGLFPFDKTAIPMLTVEQVASGSIPMPPLDEQAAIASFLNRETARIDSLIAEQDSLITLLDEKRQATISHAVTKGLNPDAPMKDSGVAWLGNVPAHWSVVPIKHLGRIGNGSTPNRDNPDYWAEDGFPWLNSSVVNQDEVSEAQQFVTPTALKECHLPIVSPPAVLVGITGQGKTRGLATKLCFTATVNQHLAYIKPNEQELSVPHLIRVLEAAYDHLRTESEGAGSTKGAITCDQLGRLRIPAPSIAEQVEITEWLNCETAKLDALKSESDQAIALLKERRSALIAAAVTGQLDVRGTVKKEIECTEMVA